MSVLVKGMEMPQSCPFEIIGVGYDMFCSFACGVPARVEEYNECCENGTRPDWCPLAPVPPHGRLIDADAMEKLMSDTVQGDIRGYPYSDTLWDMAFRWIDHQPTVIPADKDGEI